MLPRGLKLVDSGFCCLTLKGDSNSFDIGIILIWPGQFMQDSLKQQLTAFEAACRKAGLRLTPQRIEIFRELAKAGDHPSAESLHLRLLEKMPTLSLDTVYRTLGTFAGYGLINKVDTIESQARFEVAQILHHHLICRQCKEIIDFHWQFIDEATLPEAVKAWGRVERKNVVAYGTCHNCLSDQ